MIFEILVLIPNGFVDPFLWSIIKCRITNTSKNIGSKKWNVKKRDKVGKSTENPPQIHCTITKPKIGILEIKFVITVAPQKDICPQGRTYPKKEIPIIASNKTTPILQVKFWKKQKKKIFLSICLYKIIKIIDAPFIWVYCKIQPIIIL